MDQSSKTDKAQLSKTDFSRISRFIYSYCGINLSPVKHSLLENRLQKRLRHLNYNSMTEYCDFVMSREGIEQELVHMIDVVSTNKTDFFREPAHFDFLKNTVVPDYLKRNDPNPFNVWSSACSSGEEPYTIAMVLQEFSGLNYSITATDISTRVLEKGIQATYPEEDAKDIPLEMRKKYLLKSKNKTEGLIKIVPQLRSNIRFQRINLMDARLPVDKYYHVVFCRNVLIYFDHATQEKVVTNLVNHIYPGGYLFIGHSESLFRMNLDLKQVKPAIYQKR